MKHFFLALAFLLAVPAFAGSREVVNPDVDGDLKVIVNDGGTPRTPIKVTGSTSAVTIGDAAAPALHTVNGALSYGTSATLANGVNVTGVSTLTHTAASSLTIDNFTGGVDGQQIQIVMAVANPAHLITLDHDAGVGSNRLQLPDNTDITLTSNGGAVFQRVSGFWQLISTSGSGRGIRQATRSTNLNAAATGLYVEVISITLDAGEWDIWGGAQLFRNTATLTDYCVVIETTTATGNCTQSGISAYAGTSGTASGGTISSAKIGPMPVTVPAGTTVTYYLNASIGYSAGGPPIWRGHLRARRVN